MHTKNLVFAGLPLTEAKKALIMLHGRGATAEDIMSLSEYLNVQDYAIIAPQAANYAWYPYSFLAPQKQNEPWLFSAISLIGEVIGDLNKKEISNEGIIILGFSQGACLALEFAARNAGRYGGIVAFTGGLIGDKISLENYKGDFQQTPIFIGTSDPDPHVPVDRVNYSSEILQKMNADVTLKIYKNMGHTINDDEISSVNELIFSQQEEKG